MRELPREVTTAADGSFALIHCQAGGQSGVWLHYLATDDQRSEYLCGCYQIASW